MKQEVDKIKEKEWSTYRIGFNTLFNRSFNKLEGLFESEITPKMAVSQGLGGVVGLMGIEG